MTRDAITPLVDDDISAIAEIHAACFDEAWSPRVLRRIVAMPGAFGLVLRQASEEIAGFALGRIAADECELLSIGVAPRHRGQGIGRRLVLAAMARATAGNASQFFLEVAETNDVARRLYRELGLAAVGRRPRYYELKGGGHIDAVTMRCDLPAVRGDAPRRDQPSRPSTSNIE